MCSFDTFRVQLDKNRYCILAVFQYVFINAYFIFNAFLLKKKYARLSRALHYTLFVFLLQGRCNDGVFENWSGFGNVWCKLF